MIRLIGRKVDREVIIDIGCLLLLGFLSLTWFRGNNLISGGDFGLPLDWVKFFKLGFTSWNEGMSLGTYRLFAPLLPYAFLGSVLQLIGFPLVLIEMIFFYLWFTGSGLSMYFLCSVLGMRRLGRIFAAVFYMLNPFSLVIIWRVSHGTIQMPYAFAPLVLAVFIKGIEEKRWLKYIILSALGLFFLTGSAYNNPRLVISHFIPVFFYLLSVIFFEKEKRKQTLKFSFVFCSFSLFLCLYWFFVSGNSLVEGYKITHYAVPSSSDMDSLKQTSVDLLKAIRMLGYFSLSGGNKGEPYYPFWQFYTSLPANIISWLIPLLVILGFFQKEARQRKKLFFYVGIISFGLWGIKGPLPPLGGVIVWLYQHIPYSLVIARFSFLLYGMPTYLIFSILVGFGFLTLYDLGQKKFKNLVYIPLLILAVLLNVFLVFPFWNGEVIKAEGKISPGERFRLPAYWEEAKKFLAEQKDYFRVLPLPMSRTYNSAFYWGEGYGGVDLLNWLTDHPVINVNTGDSFRIPEILGNLIEKETNFRESVKILGLLNVKYLLFRNDTRWQYLLGHSMWFVHNPENIQKFLKNQNNLSLEKEFGELKFYEINQEYLYPHIYIPQNLVWVDGEVESIAEISEFIDPTEKPGIFFAGQNLPKEQGSPLSFEKSNEAFIWRQPLPFDEKSRGSWKQPVYEFNLPEEGKYDLYLRDDDLFNYYQFPEGAMMFRVDEKENEKTVLKKWGSNLIYLGELYLGGGFHRITLSLPQPINLVSDPSLSEESGWKTVEFMPSAASGKEAAFNLSPDSSLKKLSFDLSTSKNLAAIFSPLSLYRLGDIYDISFLTKHLGGSSPLAAIWENEEKALVPVWNTTNSSFGSLEPQTFFSTLRLPADNSWKEYFFIFKPKTITQMAGLAFFAEPSNASVLQKTENLYDGIKVERIFNNPLVLRRKLENSSENKPIISFKKISSTQYEVDIKGAVSPFFMIFSEAYDANWRASVEGSHLIFNGFANGWYFQKTGDFKVKLTYERQKVLFGLMIMVSLVIFLSLLYVFLIDRKI